MWISSAPSIIAVCTKIDWDISIPPEDDFGLQVNRTQFSAEFVDYLRKYPNQRVVTTLFINGGSGIPGEQMILTAEFFYTANLIIMVIKHWFSGIKQSECIEVTATARVKDVDRAFWKYK